LPKARGTRIAAAGFSKMNDGRVKEGMKAVMMRRIEWNRDY
jgi:hypothetical protein